VRCYDGESAAVLAVVFCSDEAAVHGGIIPMARLHLGLVPTRRERREEKERGPALSSPCVTPLVLW
jgi:hypothetical protein